MRKNRIFASILLCLLITPILFFSCKKGTSSKVDETVYNVEYFSKKFLNDSSFTAFFKASVTNSFKLNKMFSTSASKSTAKAATETDSLQAYTMVTEIVTAEVMLQNVHPQFFELTIEEQQLVCSNVCAKLADENYVNENPTNELVVYTNETLAYVNTYGPSMRSQKGASIDITRGELAICTAGLLGAVIGEYGGIVGQVWNLFRYGTKFLTWSSVFDIAFTVVKNAVPWFKVASIAIGYATCLWAYA